MKPWVRSVVVLVAGACLLLFLAAVAVGIVFTVQYNSLEPEARALARELHPRSGSTGKVVLSLSSASVTVKAGPAGSPIRVASNFDPDVFRLEHAYVEDGEGGWTYRVDFHEVTNFHISVVGIWLGKRSPEVSIELPPDLPLILEARMEGGYLALDLAGLALTTTRLELDRGVLGMIVSEPLTVPLERLSVDGRIGTMILQSVGNASPRELNVSHGIGATLVDLDGMWRTDSDVDLEVVLANSKVVLPGGVNIKGLEPEIPNRSGILEGEFPPPTLHITRQSRAGDIRIVD